MTMLITKFQRLIQNKILWVVFMLLVIISFVFWGTQTPDPDDFASQTSPGELYGKPVPVEEFFLARFSVYVGLVLQSGQAISLSRDILTEVDKIAWKRLISLRKTRELGITVGEDEIREALEQNFSTDGEFDYQAYTAFVTRDLSSATLSQLGVQMTRKRFEHHLAEEIALSKLRQMISQTTLTSPYEVEREFNGSFDEFNIGYALLRPGDAGDDLDVTEEDARDFFAANKEQFKLAEQVSVKYVKFPVDDYLDPDAVTPEHIQSYYDTNLDQFSVINSNSLAGTFVAATNTPATAADPVTYRDLDEVSDEIREKLALEAAAFKALEKANNLVYLLPTDRDGNAPEFEEAAKSMNMKSQSTGLFSESLDLPEIVYGFNEFFDTASQLFPNDDEYFSNPVPAEDGVYVLALEKRVEPRIPTFIEVQDEVMPLARIEAQRKALRDRAAELSAALNEVSSTNEVADIFSEFGLTVTDTGPFTVGAGLTNEVFAQAITRAVYDRNKGEAAEPIETQDGMLVSFVLDRKPADPSELLAVEADITRLLGTQISTRLFSDWQTQLLADANFRTQEEIFNATDTEQESSEDGADESDTNSAGTESEPEAT